MRRHASTASLGRIAEEAGVSRATVSMALRNHPRIPAATRTRVGEETANGRIGAALGRILGRVVRDTGVRRAVISGGDTSGHAARQLGIHALTALAPTIPGAAICRAWSDEAAVDGLELALKGGQMGSEDYFGRVRDGGG